VFFVDEEYGKGYSIFHGTTTPALLISGLSGGSSAYVDSSDNDYFPSNYRGWVVKVPYLQRLGRNKNVSATKKV
jgi:hypothetical protein